MVYDVSMKSCTFTQMKLEQLIVTTYFKRYDDDDDDLHYCLEVSFVFDAFSCV